VHDLSLPAKGKAHVCAHVLPVNKRTVRTQRGFVRVVSYSLASVADGGAGGDGGGGGDDDDDGGGLVVVMVVVVVVMMVVMMMLGKARSHVISLVGWLVFDGTFQHK